MAYIGIIIKRIYNISKTAISRWVSLFRKECQEIKKAIKSLMLWKNIAKLKGNLKNLKKENVF